MSENPYAPPTVEPDQAKPALDLRSIALQAALSVIAAIVSGIVGGVTLFVSMDVLKSVIDPSVLPNFDLIPIAFSGLVTLATVVACAIGIRRITAPRQESRN